jgi:hypothetical protein
MNVSLIEMVLAIALSGLILASAILPTTQVIVTYQEAELDGQTMMAQSAAALRAATLVNSIWRDPNAPAGYAALQAANPNAFRVGDWQWRASGGRVEQRGQSGGWAVLATPVDAVSLQYLLGDGTWTSAPGGSRLSDVIAIRFNWTDPDCSLAYGGIRVPPDRSFAAGVVSLPTPSTTNPYRRADYTRSTTLPLGTWR